MFEVITDHSALAWVLNHPKPLCDGQSDSSSNDVTYRKGQWPQAPDALSCSPVECLRWPWYGRWYVWKTWHDRHG